MTLSEYAEKFIGRPYIWGGDGSGKCSGGFDCSGLVLECLKALGLWYGADLTAQRMYSTLQEKCLWRSCSSIKKNDLLFFGKDHKHISHVAISIGEGLMIEAGGGGSACKTQSTSTGMVRIRPTDSRADLVGILRE